MTIILKEIFVTRFFILKKRVTINDCNKTLLVNKYLTVTKPTTLSQKARIRHI